MQLVQERDGKHQLPASTVFAEPEIETLEALVPTLEGNTERQKNPHPARRLARAGWVIACLGRLERLLQTPGANYLAAGVGAVPGNPPRAVTWIGIGMKM